MVVLLLLFMGCGIPCADKTVKLWKISERYRRYCNLNTVTDEGVKRDEGSIKHLRVPVKVQDDVSIEAMPRRIFSNAHTYHINSISVNSDDCTYLSADDLRINLWDLERTDQSFSILQISWITSHILMRLTCLTFDLHPGYECRYTFQRYIRRQIKSFPPPAFLTRLPAFPTSTNHICGSPSPFFRCISLTLSSPQKRRGGHQTHQHGGADRSDHGLHLPPHTLQRVCVQQQQRHDPTVRHEGEGPVRCTRKM